MDWSSNQIREWRDAQQNRNKMTEEQLRIIKRELRWFVPATGSLKINVDASVFTDASSFSVDMMACDEKWCFISGKWMTIEGTVSNLEAETFGIRETLSWIVRDFPQHIVVENDSLQVVNAINRRTQFPLEAGYLLNDSTALISSRNNVSLVFVEKRANRTVHLMVRVSYTLNC